MTYAELLAEIELLSKRSDIDDKIAIALRMTTLRVHQSDYFWRDLVEATVTFAESQEVTIDVSTQFTRFRQMDHIRYMDATSGALGSFLEPVAPSDLVDEYNYIREDRYYLAGTNLNMRFMYATAAAKVGYWQNPDVAAATYNSWVKDQMPDILIQGSLAYLFNMMGKQEEAKAINRMVGLEVDPTNRFPGMTMLEQLKASNIRPDGHA